MQKEKQCLQNAQQTDRASGTKERLLSVQRIGLGFRTRKQQDPKVGCNHKWKG